MDYDALKKLCDEATPGPWYLAENDGAICSDANETRITDNDMPYEDAAFVIAARTAVPALLAERDGLAAQLAEAHEKHKADETRVDYLLVDRDQMDALRKAANTERDALAAANVELAANAEFLEAERDAFAQERIQLAAQAGDARVAALMFKAERDALRKERDEESRLRWQLGEEEAKLRAQVERMRAALASCNADRADEVEGKHQAIRAVEETRRDLQVALANTDALRAENERMRAALESFAQNGFCADANPTRRVLPDEKGHEVSAYYVRYMHAVSDGVKLTARAALNP